MEGDAKGGLTVFWADDGLDTGPVLLQKQCDVHINDTVDTLYSRFLYPEGIRAVVSGVQLWSLLSLGLSYSNKYGGLKSVQ